jgi:ribosome-associated protein
VAAQHVQLRNNLKSHLMFQTAAQYTIEELNEAIVEGIRDKKGKKIIMLDLRHLHDASADFFIVCEGDSNVHVKSIAEGVRRRVKDDIHTSPAHMEGSMNAKWVCMDYFATVVHVFYPETREFYQIEDLWNDAKVTEFEDL